MIRIAEPKRIDLNHSEINAIQDSDGIRNYVFDRASFYIDSTRLNNIAVRVTFVEGFERPDSISVYYFQQIGSLYVQPNDLILNQNNPVIIRPSESDFWKDNPLYVDKIGFMINKGRQSDCSLIAEVFKVI
ncbi:MAG TPA: hypothetical protein VN026_12470 [Bacteroidia bacterium]|jgi:hypothetical protein|nr:hypothetical protein [Bacteroidia bacterium]